MTRKAFKFAKNSKYSKYSKKISNFEKQKKTILNC